MNYHKIIMSTSRTVMSPYRIIRYLFIMWLTLNLLGCRSTLEKRSGPDITIENKTMRLVIASDGTARSLIHKASGEECLMQDVRKPAFAITQKRPYDNELMLAYPAKAKTFGADTVYRVGNDLVIGFELIDYQAIVGLTITEDYIGFTLKELQYHMAEFGVKRRTPVDEFTLLQLPVRDRAHFGEWLNVSWDEKLAINLLATVPYTRIDATDLDGYKLFHASATGSIRLEKASAALIVSEKEQLLDHIDRVERDYGLPLGVESRRSEAYKYSYYELRNVTVNNIDEHIAYARQGGFRQMVIYYPDFARSMGHFPWRKEFPNGMADLKEITGKIERAGMIPGFHIHYSKAQKNDPYVTPVPDNRLNLRRVFTLAEDIDRHSATITVEENPEGITLDEGRRLLKIGRELVAYEDYTTSPPYQFLNCARGALNTTTVARESGDLIGLLDVDTWPIFVRFNQQTDIQEEVAARLAGIIEEAGFKFIYYDGAEDVPPPFWYNVSRAQLAVHHALITKPVFSEGALKSHFSWHIITRGNAFDIFPPEVMKEATRKHPLAEIAHVSDDFTSIDFGWIGYVAPGDNTMGTQPDMIEYVTSRAAGWNSVISLIGELEQFRNHPRNADNLEVIRRWEEVRASGFLTVEQKRMLQDPGQEHILLVNEKGEYELQPCQILSEGEGTGNIRAFIFTRGQQPWVVYWHTTGNGNLVLPVGRDKITLFEEPGKEMALQGNNETCVIPAGKRRYIRFELSRKEVVELFASLFPES